MAMQDDRHSLSQGGDSSDNPFAARLEKPIRRSEFLGNAGKLAAGAFGLGGLGSLLSRRARQPTPRPGPRALCRTDACPGSAS